MLRLLRRVSLPYLRANLGRTALVVGGIAAGVAMMVGIAISNASVLAGFRHAIESVAGPADLEVTLGFGEVGFDEGVLELVRADPDVEAAAPLVRGTIQLGADRAAEAVPLFGVDLTAEETLGRYRIRLATSRREASMALLAPRSLILTAPLAAEHGWQVGSEIEISTARGIERMTVRGLLEPEGLATVLGGRIALMDFPAAQWLLAKDGRLDQIDVLLRPGTDVAAVAPRLNARLPSPLQARSPAQRGRQYDGVLAAVQAMHSGLSTLCLIAGTYLVYNTTASGAVQRATVLAGLRLVGASTAQLLRILVIEALALGLVGAGLGFLLGIGLAHRLIQRVPHGLGIVFQLRFPIDTLVIDPVPQLLICALGIGACLLASSLVARRLVTRDPLEVLRGGLRPEPITRAGIRRLLVLTAVVVGLSGAAFVAEVRLKSFAWGNVGSSLWNASAVLVAVPFVAILGGWLAPRLRRASPGAGAVAADSLLRSTTRTGVTVAAVALMLAASVTLASLSVSFKRSMDGWLGVALAGDVVVSATTTEGGWLESPVSEDLATRLAGVPGVVRVDTLRLVPGQSFRGQRIALLATSPGFFEPTRLPAGWYREGDPVTAAPRLIAGTAAAVSVSLADRFDLHVGDVLELESPTGIVTLPIVGVQPDYTSDRGTVMLSRDLLVARWREPTISRAVLTLAPATDLAALRAGIVAHVGERYRVKIQSLAEAMAYIRAKIDEAFTFTDAVQLLLAIVTIAGVLDLLLSAITERRRELALWRLIGADAADVRRAVVIESAAIGAMGVALGSILGLATAWIWIDVNYRYLLGFFLEFHPAYASLAVSAALIVAMTAAAGRGAARAALRHAVIRDLRAE